MLRFFQVILISALLFLAGTDSRAQKQAGKDTSSARADSTRAKDTTARGSTRRGLNLKPADTSVAHLIQRIEEFTLTLNQFNSVLKRGFDTADILEQLPTLEEDLQISKDNINTYGRRMNLRNLNVTRILLSQIQRKLKLWQGQLFGYSTQLSTMNATMQEMRNDSSLRNLPDDSTLKALYFVQIRDLARKWRKADSTNRIGLLNIGLLQSRVAMRYLEVTDLYDDVNFRIRNFGREMFIRDDDWLWQTRPSKYPNDFISIVGRSLNRGKSVLQYYLASSLNTSALILLMGLILYFWSRHMIRKIRKESNRAEELLAGAEYIPGFPMLSSAILALVMGNFLYKYPPAAYSTILGLILFFAITDLLWFKWPRILHRYWLAMGLLYMLNSFFNLLLENTFFERICLLIQVIVAIGIGMGILNALKSNKIKYHKIAQVMIILFNVTNALSLLANVSGRFALAKLLSASAITSLFLAIGLLFVVEIILDAVYLQSEAYRSSNNLVYHFNFKEVKDRIRNGLVIGAGVLWFIGFSKGLSFYDFFYDGISDFLGKDRKIGNSTFSFGSIVIFILVIWISSLLSQFIAYLFGSKSQTGGVKKSRLGNFMLIARIGILAGGLLLAFAASGIPMDKLAIIIGALGVGIGFGLQNIVNNLVSGIILAFEKPVQIGDVIEVGPHSGTVKEIGFRSSKITTADGAEVVVPNGDLISQHVINWTMSNNFRRVDLKIGVAYGSDLEICKKAISEAVFDKEGILSFPRPLVLVDELAESAVIFRVLFWASDIADWVNTKSLILHGIYDHLKLAGIQIPYPQRDLHIKSVDEDFLAALKKDGSQV